MRRTVLLSTALAVALAAAGCATAPSSSSPDGLLATRSPHSARDTMNRLEDLVKQRGLNVFARIDHAAGAQRVGKTLAPTELLIFGNPQGGTPLMECSQTAGIDLPLKALVWQDSGGQVWLGVNDPAWLARRHRAPSAPDCPAAANLRGALDALVQATVKP